MSEKVVATSCGCSALPGIWTAVAHYQDSRLCAEAMSCSRPKSQMRFLTPMRATLRHPTQSLNLSPEARDHIVLNLRSRIHMIHECSSRLPRSLFHRRRRRRIRQYLHRQRMSGPLGASKQSMVRASMDQQPCHPASKASLAPPAMRAAQYTGAIQGTGTPEAHLQYAEYQY